MLTQGSGSTLYIFAMAALYKLLRMKLLFRLAARITNEWRLDSSYSLHNDISRIRAPVGKPNVDWCFILTATPPRDRLTSDHPLCYTRSGASGPAPRLSGLQTRSRAALGFLKSRPEQVYAPANRPAAPLRTLFAGAGIAA